MFLEKEHAEASLDIGQSKADIVLMPKIILQLEARWRKTSMWKQLSYISQEIFAGFLIHSLNRL